MNIVYTEKEKELIKRVEYWKKRVSEDWKIIGKLVRHKCFGNWDFCGDDKDKECQICQEPVYAQAKQLKKRGFFNFNRKEGE